MRVEPGRLADRLRRPGWNDPRLLLGIVLVALAVALGAWAVDRADETVPVLVARGDLTPGESLTEDHVGVAEARLPQLGSYLSPDEDLPADAVAVRTVGDGELIPRSAIGSVSGLGLRPVAVPIRAALAEGVRPGALVDLWFTPDGDAIAAGDVPRAVAEALTVAEVGKTGGGLSVASETTVQVLVPTEQLPAVLGVLAAEGSVTIVPLPGLGAEGER